MLQDIGQRIRTLRTSKGISLNAFAERLNVSPAYLSNLETGKTETIQLSILEKIQSDLYLLPMETDNLDVLDSRLHLAKEKFNKLEHRNPEAADYLLTTFEKGLDVLLRTN